jgi:acyl-homoserine-lactone acylase
MPVIGGKAARCLWFGAALWVPLSAALAQGPARALEVKRWHAEAQRVTITRDDWGIAHIHGRTDADAVFGMIYAQCEDDFNRVERNYLTSLGRTAEADGEAAIWADLRQRLFIDPAQLQREYTASPAWLRSLMDAWADGINFYLAQHPDVKPAVLRHFEPWMALSFTEGSIGGDIERVDLKKLEELYGGDGAAPAKAQVSRARPGAPAETGEREPGGSNGIAIAPAKTRDGHALLLINPHTSFFFRSELQMTSDEGLNAYGAVTWGQFFVYQGFNSRVGWMHTSSGVDAVDEFTETLEPVPGHGLMERYGNTDREISHATMTLRYRTPGGMAERSFNTEATGHGPLVRLSDQGEVSVSLMQEHVKALEQSFLRTRARNYADYRKTMELMANSSNNTVYADADGTIAYWHGDYIPRRNANMDYTKPVDGSDPSADWHGLLSLAEVPQLKNPVSGFLFNVNDSPWNGAGISSLKKADFPPFVERGIESARGLHAMRLLEQPDGTAKPGWTVESLRAAAYDSYLPWFARTLPALLQAYNSLPRESPLKQKVAAQVALLSAWDFRWAADSTATSLAVFWGTELLKTVAAPARQAHVPTEDWVATRVAPEVLVAALDRAATRLTTDFGSPEVPWGTINRFQRIDGDIVQPFNDAAPSIPVPFVSSVWGSLASFGARPYPGTRKWYGTSGNSFVAVVKFGPRVRAVAVTAGGESGHPSSPHFNDEAARYASGNLREVYFYPDQLKGHTVRAYKPGE